MNNFRNFFFNALIVKTYNKNLVKNGFTPIGLFWSSKKSQYSRFDTLLFLVKKMDLKKKIRLADVGCGYGSLLNYLKEKKFNCEYFGYDINKKLIDYCNENYPQNFFKCSFFPSEKVDLSVISGTYNFTVTEDIYQWEEYIIYNLKKCMENSKYGLIFNLQFSKKSSFIRNNIYYTNIQKMFNRLSDEFNNVTKFYSSKNFKDIYFTILK